MAIEIERKFLVETPPDFSGLRSATFRQGYMVSSEALAVRVRLDRDQAWLTIKSGSGDISRHEYEYPVPYADAEEMLSTVCVGSIIEKTRYYLPQGKLTWEIDVFHGDNEGLVVAEIELEDPCQTFEIPHWIGREVSDDPRYSNSSLSQCPFGSGEWAEVSSQ